MNSGLCAQLIKFSSIFLAFISAALLPRLSSTRESARLSAAVDGDSLPTLADAGEQTSRLAMLDGASPGSRP
jgi:hypothetical protein